MKYKIILLFFLTSCINNTYSSKNNFIYSSKGFAEVQNEPFINLNRNSFVFHNKLSAGTKIRISNPSNGFFAEVVVKKKMKFDDFYKVLISNNLADKLNLNISFPYIEISEIKKNKTFIAKKAITENIEKKIANKAPITKININNLSKTQKLKNNKLKNYSILIAEFYALESAEILKKKIALVLSDSNYQLIHVNKKSNNSYELLIGPYNTINKLKNDYNVLTNSNFEDLDIIIND
jgi:hypothetical protein